MAFISLLRSKNITPTKSEYHQNINYFDRALLLEQIMGVKKPGTRRRKDKGLLQHEIRLERKRSLRRVVWVQIPVTCSRKNDKRQLVVFSVIFACGEWYCFAVIFGLRRVVFAPRVKRANIISLKPYGFYITFAKQKYHSDEVGISPKYQLFWSRFAIRADYGS